ncbi:collagen-like protein, partial [Lactococcus lactis]|nr:collagen-like protein [Lactococcus lactis]
KETTADSYEWSKDGTVVANVQEITVDASGVSNKAVYSFKATINGKVVANQSVTITNVDDGTNGRSVTNVSQKWRLTTTSTRPTQSWSDAGWLTTQPTTTATNKYLWSITRTTFNLAPLTQDVIEQKAVYGDKGDQGAQGIQGLQGPTGTQGVAGPKGADGKTQYTHIAYANSADGVTDFSTSDSNRTYIGMYVDFIINDSTTPGDYSWTLVKGADGTQGTPGKPGADGKTPYFHTAWSYSADGTDGFTTVYPTLNLLNGTKDFTKGTWANIASYKNAGTLNGLTVKTLVGTTNIGMYKDYTIPTSGTYTASMFVKTNGVTAEFDTQVVGGSTVRIDTNSQVFVRKSYTASYTAGQVVRFYARLKNNADAAEGALSVAGYKIEPGSTATPWMPSSSEATTADWPSYIGQYTDFTQADSTNPSDYTWSLIRGNDGADGQDGKDGTNGKDGDPGKVVSDTEPTTRFKGLTWKYSGTVDLTASDGTVIKPNTEYYFNGKNWMINFLSANNIDANSITAEKINGTDLEVKNGKFTDGVIETSWKNGTVAGSTNIEKDHLIITRTDS